VECVGTIVRRNLVVLSVDGEVPLGDAVPVAPDDGAKGGIVELQVTGKVGESKDDVVFLSGAIWSPDAYQVRAVRRYTDLNLFTGKREEVDRDTLEGLPPC